MNDYYQYLPYVIGALLFWGIYRQITARHK